MPKPDPRITKRKVTMRSVVLAPEPAAESDAEPGWPTYLTLEATDYVRPDFLDAYLAEARGRWQQVTVSDAPDAGPGGYAGATHVPDRLDHDLAGRTFPAEQED